MANAKFRSSMQILRNILNNFMRSVAAKGCDTGAYNRRRVTGALREVRSAQVRGCSLRKKRRERRRRNIVGIFLWITSSVPIYNYSRTCDHGDGQRTENVCIFANIVECQRASARVLECVRTAKAHGINNEERAKRHS